MAETITIFTDRDGDKLCVVPRNIDGDTISDPIITITTHFAEFPRSQSVVLDEAEAAVIIIDMVKVFNLSNNLIQLVRRELEQFVEERKQND